MSNDVYEELQKNNKTILLFLKVANFQKKSKDYSLWYCSENWL